MRALNAPKAPCWYTAEWHAETMLPETLCREGLRERTSSSAFAARAHEASPSQHDQSRLRQQHVPEPAELPREDRLPLQRQANSSPHPSEKESPPEQDLASYRSRLRAAGQGMIALSAQKFPEGSKGPQVDALARQHLWNRGLDYLHGTGHGVGHFLNVHEGPIGISPRLASVASLHNLRPGAVLSIEPGFYQDGNFGIRIENLVTVKESTLNYRGRKFLHFESLTLVPIQAKLIDFSLLSPYEVEWLDAYHQDVFNRISARLAASQKEHFCPPLPQAVSISRADVLAWLRKSTRPLQQLLQSD
ncbi:putative X-prolyl aminopeptidase [Cyclospora cayetanensis]|uniref:X-prolyl aminopeptidase n=1 Tax=Cyclospora cayetanensis TaxID=88456 RepID=A0A1D3D8N1_9EIME|nr:putative X-prolyl aminopeptidase [Cyclospora cayetanensis]